MTKKNDLAPEQKASAEFDKALSGLSILTTPLDRSAAPSDKPISEIESKSSFRDELLALTIYLSLVGSRALFHFDPTPVDKSVSY